MKCKFCGGNRFYAKQKVFLDVIVDGNNNWIKNDRNGGESEDPYGDYTCVKCGAEYATLNEGEPEISGPVDGWKENLTTFHVVSEQEMTSAMGKLKVINFESFHYVGCMEVVPEDGKLLLVRADINRKTPYSVANTPVLGLVFAPTTTDKSAEVKPIEQFIKIATLWSIVPAAEVDKVAAAFERTVEERENLITFLESLNVEARVFWGLKQN